MKKFSVVLLFAAALLLAGCFPLRILGVNQVVGSGNMITETRQVSGFDSVELSGSGDVEIIFGEEESVTVEADDNLMDLIETNVVGGELRLGYKPNTSVTSLRTIHFTVTMKSLENASINGSGSVEITENHFDSLELRVSGSGKILAAGTASSLRVELPGSGEIDCGSLQTGSANVNISGSGDVIVDVQQNLDVTISGSGTVRYFGSPSSINERITGSGEIRKLN